MERKPFAVIVEEVSNGFMAYCPSLTACYSQGKTCEEALENLKSEIQHDYQALLARGASYRALGFVGLAILEVDV